MWLLINAGLIGKYITKGGTNHSKTKHSAKCVRSCCEISNIENIGNTSAIVIFLEVYPDYEIVFSSIIIRSSQNFYGWKFPK